MATRAFDAVREPQIELIEDTRAQIERNHARSPSEQLFRRMLFAVFTHPGRLRVLAPLLAASRRVGLVRAARAPRPLGRFPRLRTLLGLAPDAPLRSSLKRLTEITPAVGPARARVALLQGC